MAASKVACLSAGRGSGRLSRYGLRILMILALTKLTCVSGSVATIVHPVSDFDGRSFNHGSQSESQLQSRFHTVSCGTSKSLLISKYKATWRDAEKECQMNGGHLSSLDFVKPGSPCDGSLPMEAEKDDYFVGVTTLIDNAEARSIANSNLLRVNSLITQLRPHRHYGCGVIQLPGSGKMGGRETLSACDYPSNFLCEIEKDFVPLSLPYCEVTQSSYTFHTVAVDYQHAEEVCSQSASQLADLDDDVSCIGKLYDEFHSQLKVDQVDYQPYYVSKHMPHDGAHGNSSDDCLYYQQAGGFKTRESCRLARPVICKQTVAMSRIGPEQRTFIKLPQQVNELEAAQVQCPTGFRLPSEDDAWRFHEYCTQFQSEHSGNGLGSFWVDSEHRSAYDCSSHTILSNHTV